GSILEKLRDSCESFSRLRSLACNNAEIKLCQRRWIICCAKPDVELMSSGNAKPLLIQRRGMVCASHKCPNLCYACEMRRIEAANGATSDNANPLHLRFPATFSNAAL